MPTPYDVPSPVLIEKLAQYLKNNVDSVKPPEWAPYVKTGVYAQRPPQNADWWYVRCASLLRKIYAKGPIGLEHLASEYGGRKSFGVKPQHSRKGSSTVTRQALHQLQNAGFVEIAKPKRAHSDSCRKKDSGYFVC